MNLWQSIGGELTVELTSADISGFLAAAQNAQVEIRNVEIAGPLRIRFQIRRDAWACLQALAQRRGEKLERTGKTGLYWSLARLRRRPVLVLGLLFLLVFSLWAPSRVFFIQVEGNGQIPARKIIECAARCGISFGASRREVRSERMKNALLQAMPELSWAGVNTSGCTAVISVRERKDQQQAQVQQTVSSIVASRDGIIAQTTVLQGNKLCAEGQAVKQGQVLISGYTDCGLSIQATNAKGEVFAYTNRQLSALCPIFFTKRGQTVRSEKNYSLIVGNKRINFSNNSGISDTGCAKIYEEKYLVLPGGFQLPLAVCVETVIYYQTEAAEADAASDTLSAFARQYISAQMCAGSILLADVQFTQTENALLLRGSYSCHEMIGITRLEESIWNYAEND